MVSGCWGWGLLLVPMSEPKEEVRVSVQGELLGERAGIPVSLRKGGKEGGVSIFRTPSVEAGAGLGGQGRI